MIVPLVSKSLELTNENLYHMHGNEKSFFELLIASTWSLWTNILFEKLYI
jgi:hypothetical protein